VPASRSASSAGSRSPVGLSRELIVDAAIALIERDGPGALTMRRLGAELGVEAMSLYNHVANRDALVTAVGDRILQPLGELDLDAPWRTCGRRFAQALRDVALRRPATFLLVGLQPLDTPASLHGVERLLAAFVAQGLSPIEALAAYRALVSYARGYALAETTGFTVDAARPEGRERLRALPAQRFPILHRHADDLAALGADDAFERGLQALLAGLPDPS
jgi:AcrR family transcriptional regulator